jgi:hypothetical protein
MIKISSGVIAALLLVACSKADIRQAMGQEDTQRAWTEDVLLADGTTLLVKRTVVFRETDAWGGGAYNAVESDATVAFTAELAQLPVWRAPLMALLLYRDEATSEWVLVATSTSCEQWNRLGAPRVLYLPNKPDTLYWEYRLRPEAWQEVPLSKSSIGRPVNLLHRYQEELGTEHVSVAFRQRRESGGQFPELKLIVEDFKENCTVSVENKALRAEMDSKETSLEVVEE